MFGLITYFHIILKPAQLLTSDKKWWWRNETSIKHHQVVISKERMVAYLHFKAARLTIPAMEDSTTKKEITKSQQTTRSKKSLTK